jgi:hypothetical protein
MAFIPTYTAMWHEHSTLAATLLHCKRDHKATLRAHTWLIIRWFMNVMQDSAKRDLVGGTGVEKSLGRAGPFPEVCQPGERLLALCFEWKVSRPTVFRTD